MEKSLIPLSRRRIADKDEPTVSARKLHAFLGVRRDFSNWIRDRIRRYEFEKDQDYTEVFAKTGENPKGGRPASDFYISLDMARELCMLSRGERGKEARQYFIACERELKESQEQARPKALPVPVEDALAAELRSAVNRRAHALSLRGYDAIRQRLAEWARQWAGDYGPQEALKRLEAYDGLSGEMVFVNAETLWDITAATSSMKLTVEHAINRIESLEHETGHRWYHRVSL